jgi:nucleoside-diphosphate-sugar epimerase
MSEKILITGANGFIGKNTLPILLKTGYEVHAVSTKKLESKDIQWHQLNLFDTEGTQNLMKKIKPRYLLHLAWDTTPGKYLKTADNLNLVCATLSLCRSFYECGGCRGVFGGTLSEYKEGSKIYTESSPRKASSLYGVCKSSLFDMIEAYCSSEDLSFAWGRVFFLYGPYENENRVVPYVIKSLLAGKDALCSDGVAKKDYLYAGDMAAAFVHLLGVRQNGAFNIGSGKAVPLKDILKKTAEIIGRPELLHLGARQSRPGEPQCVTADIDKLRATGFMPAYDMDSGLKETVKWWKSNLDK